MITPSTLLLPGISFFRMLCKYSMSQKWPFSALYFNLDSVGGVLVSLFVFLKSYPERPALWKKVSLNSKTSFSRTSMGFRTPHLVFYKVQHRKTNMGQNILPSCYRERGNTILLSHRSCWKLGTPYLRERILDFLGKWNLRNAWNLDVRPKIIYQITTYVHLFLPKIGPLVYLRHVKVPRVRK